MEFSEITQYALYFGSAMFIVAFFFGLREMARRSYRKTATDEKGNQKIRLAIIGGDDNEVMSWGIKDGLVIKDESSGEEYPIKNVRFTRVRYPEGGMFSGLGVVVQKAMFIQGNPHPIMRKDDNIEPTNVATIAGLMRNERFLAVVTNAVRQLQDAFGGKGHQGISPIWLYGLLGFSILASAGVLFVLVYVVLPLLELLKVGAGV